MFNLFNPYIIVGSVMAAIGLVAVVSRLRKTPAADQVAPSVLNRIRTEYR